MPGFKYGSGKNKKTVLLEDGFLKDLLVLES